LKHSAPHHDAVAIAVAIEGLERDGLIERTGRRLRLRF